MSYEEVERGLPPVNVVNTPVWKKKLERPPIPSTLSPDRDPESGFPIPIETLPNNKDPNPNDLKTSPVTVTPNTHRYIIEEDEDEMKVYKVDLLDPPSPLPNEFYISGQEADMAEGRGSRWRKVASSLLLHLIPALLFTLSLHLVKSQMSGYHFHIIGLMFFQSILWASLFFLLIHRVWFRIQVFQNLSCSSEGLQNWIGLMVC
jgi:hypothetical protein